MKREKSRFKGVKNAFLVLVLTGVAIISVYAFAIDKVTDDSKIEVEDLQAKIGGLQSVLEDYEIKDGQVKYKNSRGVIKTIQDVCEEEEFDVELAVKIAACESYLNPYFFQINKNGTVDRGVFAFNDLYYESVSNECAFNVECATRTFIKQAKAGKINDWLCYKRVK